MSLELSSSQPKFGRSTARRSRFASRLLDRYCGSLDCGSIAIRFPDGAVWHRAGTLPGPAAQFEIGRWKALRRILVGGALGFAEAYMEGELDTGDLRTLIAFALANKAGLENRLTGLVSARLWNRLRHLCRANTRRGSRRNVAAHYDLGNTFYRLWLDETMSYSAGVFETGGEDLATAQRNKYRRIAEMAGLNPGANVLEIGCGWGGFAQYAAREFDCRVTGLTLSAEQLRYAQARVHRAGLADRIELRLQDYRDCRGRYDAVVSIEMFEAVGERNWPNYFRLLADRLAPEGIAALQVITIHDDRFDLYRRSADFIQRYIFPGGMLPTAGLIARHAASAGLTVTDRRTFGGDYARTLAVWADAFAANWPKIRRLGFDERFRRMWEYYLAYCEAGFRNGTIDVVQFQFRRA
jgi:cyclopropane-fatty-acyl-phospholipid synthase